MTSLTNRTLSVNWSCTWFRGKKRNTCHFIDLAFQGCSTRTERDALRVLRWLFGKIPPIPPRQFYNVDKTMLN